MMQTTEKTTAQVGLRMPEDMRDELRELAAIEGRTFSNMILWILANHIKAHGHTKGKSEGPTAKTRR